MDEAEFPDWTTPSSDEARELLRSRLCAKGEESVRDARCEFPSALRLGPISEAGVSPLLPAFYAGGS